MSLATDDEPKCWCGEWGSMEFLGERFCPPHYKEAVEDWVGIDDNSYSQLNNMYA